MTTGSAATGAWERPIEVGCVDPLDGRTVESIRELLSAPTWTCRFIVRDGSPDLSALGPCDAILVIGVAVDAKVLEAAPRLQVVQKVGAGIEKIDRSVCERRGIGILRLAGGNAEEVAEHTVMAMIAALRNITMFQRLTRAGQWPKELARGENRSLRGRHVGLVGFGAIGREVASRLRAFGVEIAYHDPTPADPEVERRYGVARLPLDELLGVSDIISLHLPLTAGTRHIIDRDAIRKMRRGAVLVNAARGGLVDEVALADALDRGHIAVAALDTFEVEPPAAGALLSSDRTIVTPHIAGATRDNVPNVIGRAAANVLDYLNGRALRPNDVVYDARPTSPVGTTRLGRDLRD